MSNAKQVSRRDWFRLGKSAGAENSLGVEDRARHSDTLQPVAHPPNHDGMDLSELPPMRKAVLTREQVSDLFSDIGQLATDILLMQKSRNAPDWATASRASERQRLQIAQTALLQGQVPRLQVRYRWQASLWIDTLSRTDDGFQLIRIAHKKPEGND